MSARDFDPEESCTKVEVSEILGLSLQAVDDLVDTGVLRSRKAGRTFLVSRPDVERFMLRDTE